MKSQKSLVLLSLFIGGSLMRALPVAYIERDDVPFLAGQWARFDQNTSVFEWEQFDSMRTWWDLTALPGGSLARIHLYNENQGIPPAPDSMPNAEIAELDTLGTGDVVWTYMYQTPNFFYVDGIDLEMLGFRFIGNYQPDYRAYQYPVFDGLTWTTAWQWSYEVIPGYPYSATEQHQKAVVAIGKVKVPVSGDHFWPCLVILDQMDYWDTWGFSDSRSIYEWVVPGRFGGANGVAAAQSTSGGQPNFILVDNFFKMSDLYVPGWDLRCPDFANTTIWPDTAYAGPFVVSSTITDSTGVGADSLFYNINGGTFAGVGHDSVSGGTYYYTIPQIAQTCTLGYLIWAADSFSVANDVDIWNTDPICAPESTYYTFEAQTGIAECPSTPVQAHTLSCYPNPCPGQLTIACAVRGSAPGRIRIFDATGRIVRTYTAPQNTECSLLWCGEDDHARRLAGGVYFVEMKVSDWLCVQPVVLIR